MPAGAETFKVDLLNLPWKDRWDVVFLLDVFEHIPDHEEALRQIYRVLATGGLLFITTPALQMFWSWNDELARHVRRYSGADFRHLSAACGYRLLRVKLLHVLSQPAAAGHEARRPPGPQGHAARTVERKLIIKMHSVPGPIINTVLGLIFSCETPLGHYLPFPWGSSILAVLRKPWRSLNDD